MRKRDQLAILGGFLRPKDSAAHGTQQSGYALCQALARSGRYAALDVYCDLDPRKADAQFVPPRELPVQVFDRSSLSGAAPCYETIYASNGDQIQAAPHLLRPMADWAPMVCSVGTAHLASQWAFWLVAYACRAVRPSDGLVFKSSTTEAVFRRVWSDWNQLFGRQAAFPLSCVIPNGTDVRSLRRSAGLRARTRAQLGLTERDVLFLSYSRISQGTKGDPRALIIAWREVLARHPTAFLLISGMLVDPSFCLELRALAQRAGVANRVALLENPYDHFADARGCLMSAADVFLHLTTGVEESSPLVVSEAKSHGLPVLATRWAGLPEVVSDGHSGLLVPTCAAPVPTSVSLAAFAVHSSLHARQAARHVSCDWRAFRQAAGQLIEDPALRSRLGGHARLEAEQNSIDVVAHRYADFFQSTAEAAERDWPTAGATQVRPLVDVNHVLEALSWGGLGLDHEIRTADAGALALAPLGIDDQMGDLIRSRLVSKVGQDPVTVEQARSLLLEAGSGTVEPDTLDGANALLMSLANYGVLNLSPPTD